jgi:3-oxoacyl-[acyl-carrier-protein] synthase II
MGRRVVITAMGAVTSLGDDFQTISDSIRLERVCFRRCASGDPIVVAPVAEFDLRRHTGRHKNLRYLNRGAAMAVAAAAQAIRNASLSEAQRRRAGLFVGAGPNLDLGTECAQIDCGKIRDHGLPALWMLRFLPNTAASAIAQLAGIHGENLSLGNACAASLQAVGEAHRRIRHGDLDLAVAGGGDSRLSDGALLAYHKAGALFCGEDSPETASRPFDASRQGFVPGEGGAFFVLESADHASRRGATVLAEVCGYSATMDGHAMAAPRPDGRWAEQAVRRALEQAGLAPEAIDLISAHGTGTTLNDAMEADMIRRIFGEKQPVVVALKSWIGHLASACGAAELAISLIALQSGQWPHIRNLAAPCNTSLNYLRQKSVADPSHLLLQNFGFGGQNAALVVGRWRS